MEVHVVAPSIRFRSSCEFPPGSVVGDVLDRFVPQQNFYVTTNGRLSGPEERLQHGAVYHLEARLCGGKGGFGSMLRALGAQIEKTTNREACRDLSGRRLRDVNHEKEMADWLKKQAEREAEKEQRRLERLQRKLAEPKHQFTDPQYRQQCHDLSERLEDSVLKGDGSEPVTGQNRWQRGDGVCVAGLQASSGAQVTAGDASAAKRPALDQNRAPLEKKRKTAAAAAGFWTGLEELLSSDDEEEDEDDDDDGGSPPSSTGGTGTMTTHPEPSSSSSDCGSASARPATRTSDQRPGPPTEPAEDQRPGPPTEPAEDQRPGPPTEPAEDQRPGPPTEPAEDQRPGPPAEPAEDQRPGPPTEPAEDQRPGPPTEPAVGPSEEPEPAEDQRPGPPAEPAEDQRPGPPAEPAEDQRPGPPAEPAVGPPEEPEPAVGPSEEPEPAQSSREPQQQLDLSQVTCVQHLESLGLDLLKQELGRRGLKCGGTLSERAARLFAVRGLSPDRIDPALLARPAKAKKK
ncbi:replication stress response regulator SDE2 isoform X3 [Fundulus heteroclitus]|uniref:replication stress response regulator SDE2 isoform X3 n=1 Tax=Fundulus heteroclitus TaxID=8078 RepID=UPI00165C4BF2|nr:replication stress response regulator SDE2 isoform X3 [Fundulus heteroclitus]